MLGPLFAWEWEIGLPRTAVERVFRFAWHLTSVAWVGLAATLLGLPAVDAVGIICSISGGIILFTLRGHLAWPLFFFVATATWASAGALPRSGVVGVVVAAAAVAVAAGILHAYWALGGRWGLANAVPEAPDGGPAFRPGPLACSAVAVACVVLAGLLFWPLAGRPSAWAWAAVGLAAALLGARVVGDGRQTGFTKRILTTTYARADSEVYTPLFTLLLFGTLGAMYLGSS